MFHLDGRTVRVWGRGPGGEVEVIPDEAWPEGEACPVGASWIIEADDAARVLTPAP